jgi:sarcosine oxidase subunit beta
MPHKARAVICGAGIAGVSAAYFLSRAGLRDILVLDERPPLTLTSSRSTECYRNWWPDRALLGLMNRSIDLLEELANQSGNVFRLNRRGYLYVTADTSSLPKMHAEAIRISLQGGGPLRIHESPTTSYVPLSTEAYSNQPPGADLLLGSNTIRRHFPGISEQACAALHVRKAGWLSAQQLGMQLFERAREAGVTFRTGQVAEVKMAGNHVKGIVLSGGERIDCEVFINAAGPYLGRVSSLMNLPLPVRSEVHLKVTLDDPLHCIDRHAPLLIWNDPQRLSWDHDERELLEADPESRWLAGNLPAGAHTRPEGGDDGTSILMLWEYQTQEIAPVFPVPLDEKYPEVVLRGLSTMVPALRQYVGRAPRPSVDGGYYVKTPENRPLIGATAVEGAFVIGALSGYGIMAACGAGELLAAHVSGGPLPEYATACSLARYDDASYAAGLKDWESSGEL